MKGSQKTQGLGIICLLLSTSWCWADATGPRPTDVYSDVYSMGDSKVMDSRLESEPMESRFGSPPPRPLLAESPHWPDPFARPKPGGMEVSRNPAGVASGGALSPAENTLIEGTPLDPAEKSRGTQEISLIAGDLGYFPHTLVVSPGVPVRLFVTGASKKSLCLMMDHYKIRRQVRANRIEEVTFTPTVPGKYRFYCPVNGIEGLLLVKEPILTADQGKI